MIIEEPVARHLRSAQLCRIRDLQQLLILGDLIRDISELIHALQKERGASAIYLGSHGAQFAQLRAERVAHCDALSEQVLERLRSVDEHLEHLSSGARFYTRVALAVRALQGLPDTRQQIASLEIAGQEAIRTFNEVIACLLGVGFEVADIAADTAVSRALLALVNFVQGKEYAGQERALLGSAFSSGSLETQDGRRVEFLVAAQEQAFRIFAQFADGAFVTAFNKILAHRDSLAVQTMRAAALAATGTEAFREGLADDWFEHSSGRIDAMKRIEDEMAAAVGRVGRDKLAIASRELDEESTRWPDEPGTLMPVAMLVMDVDPAANQLGVEGGVGLYTVDGAIPKPMRSILDVLQAQSRHLEEMRGQLERARLALAQRKMIDRAKGMLMKRRQLSETDAYALLRATAMNQNKRIYEVAEALVNMAEILKT
ncbi:MAG TPA: nitrate- and nitrite sensing domain-containing protein [Steroidobacteraceae bacterium]|nr:nitrate- and nitrite sensing domain-containing protein [Steroidobacteraceae bacterium]